MPKFEVVSIEEALEATKETRRLDEKFGEEYELEVENETENIEKFVALEEYANEDGKLSVNKPSNGVDKESSL